MGMEGMEQKDGDALTPREEPGEQVKTSPPPASEPAPESNAAAPEPAPRRRVVLPVVLFVATCLSTLFAGMISSIPGNVDLMLFVQENLGLLLWRGFQYGGTLMAILLAHEMGHYIQTRRYGVPATLPLFIPMPLTPIGTMGAVILQRGGVADRKANFDIAISGPLAGLVIALPALVIGLQYSHYETLPSHGTVVLFGEPLLVQWLIHWQFPEMLPNQEAVLHPIAFAGWVGIFITALNLIPISQLDGGHILYGLLGRRAHTAARILWSSAVAAMIYGSLFVSEQLAGWSVMLFLTWLIGIRHPPTADDSVPLGRGRIILGWLTLAFLIIGFTPFPIYERHMGG